MLFELRIGHLYALWAPSVLHCVLVLLRPATEMLGAGSVHLARTWFLLWEMAFGVPNSPFTPTAWAVDSVR